MSEILSDLIGERVRVHPDPMVHGVSIQPSEGIVRGVAALALIIEDNNGLISARPFEYNTFIRIGDKPKPMSFDSLLTIRNAIEVAHGTKIRPRTVRGIRIGDVFKFKKPPPGWTSNKILVVDKFPGFAAPEGWDYLPIDLLDGEIELQNTDEPLCWVKHTCESLDSSGSCTGCGHWLGDMDAPEAAEEDKAIEEARLRNKAIEDAHRRTLR